MTSIAQHDKCTTFMSITGASIEDARTYLQRGDWNISTSINIYCDAKGLVGGAMGVGGHDESVVILDYEPEPIDVIDLGDTPVRLETQRPTVPPATDIVPVDVCMDRNKVKFVSWNIDGLDDRSRTRRMRYLCKLINNEMPDIVHFQEVIVDTFEYMQSHMPFYHCIASLNVNDFRNTPGIYFTATLIRKLTVDYQSHSVEQFQGTVMSRNLLIVKCSLRGVPIVSINTHLESTRDYAAERIRQLKRGFAKVAECDREAAVIFAGDLNLRDQELDSCGGIPSGMVDLYQKCGSRPECAYTWDANRNSNIEMMGGGAYSKPRCRFDRVYFRQDPKLTFKPSYFGFIGIEKIISCGRFPSDHWGLMCHFQVNNPASLRS